MPMHQITVNVHITNHSPNALVYQSNGMNLKTVAVESSSLTEFVGYDGYNIDLSRVAAIAYTHPAIKKLFGYKETDAVTRATVEQVLSLYDLLEEKSFTGENALSNYFVEYYRTKKSDSSLENWADLLSKYRDDLIKDFSIGGTDSLHYATKDVLDAARKTTIGKYIYDLEEDDDDNWSGTHLIEFKWPDKNLAEFSYNVFYQDLLSVVFGTETVERTTGNRKRGVGDYLDKNGEAYTSANAYLATIGDNGQLASGAEGEFKMTITLEGEGAGNMYAGYDFGGLFDLTLQFIPATTDIVVSKEWDDANDKDGSRPDSVTVQLYANGDKSGEPVTLDSAGDWKHTFNVPVYSRGEEITYTVEEAAVNGYTATVTGNAADGFVITNSHEPENVVDVPIDVPETGDPSHMMLWLALACLSLCGMAVVLQRTRKEN